MEVLSITRTKDYKYWVQRDDGQPPVLEDYSREIADWMREGNVPDIEVYPPTGEDVNKERVRRVLEGCSATINGLLSNSVVRIEGDAQTIQNLDSLALAAQVRITSGSLTMTTNYRDADNVVHVLTPQQVLQLWQKGATYIEACYMASWALKDTGQEIVADFADDKYWPSKNV